MDEDWRLKLIADGWKKEAEVYKLKAENQRIKVEGEKLNFEKRKLKKPSNYSYGLNLMKLEIFVRDQQSIEGAGTHLVGPNRVCALPLGVRSQNILVWAECVLPLGVRRQNIVATLNGVFLSFPLCPYV